MSLTPDRSAGDQAPISPLKIFTTAKRSIRNIFKDIGIYINEFEDFVSSIEKDDSLDVIQTNVRIDVTVSAGKVEGIIDMLARDHMKVVFFGRTSNGKSTTINAMLGDKILPSGIGHTTNCFLSVEGFDDKDGSVPYLMYTGCDEKQNVKSVSHLGHALCQERLAPESLIRMFWPKKQCALLKDEVVLVDSPGIDVSEDIDKWINQYCLDADVFILVANAESTLMLAEKKFFHRVNEKLSKPNIFILNNRWDCSASEPDQMEMVRQQHLERGISFLADELKVVSSQQAKDRVFFVSAKEVLQSRMHRNTESSQHTPYYAEGFQARLLEFLDFERNFEECISRSATKTKFEQHTIRAAKITEDLRSFANEILKNSVQSQTICEKDYEDLKSRIEFLDKQMKLVTDQAKKWLLDVVGEAERQVRSAMTDEIRRLAVLVDEFDRPFHHNPIVLKVYKAELYKHVQQGLGRNLSARCSQSLQKQIDRTKCDMIQLVLPLLSTTGTSSVDDAANSNLPDPALEFSVIKQIQSGSTPSFDVSYDIDCSSLCADFHEDIEFKFSLGFQQIIKRFFHTSQIDANHARQNESNYDVNGNEINNRDMLWSLVTGYLKLSGGQSAGIVMCVGAVPYVLYKMIGWRAIGFTVASYGGLYIYERLMWTPRAREKALKRQFVDHTKDKLNLVTTFTSSNCSQQVQQEVAGSFAQLLRCVDTVKQRLEKEASFLNIKMDHLKNIYSNAKVLRNKADWLDSEIKKFSDTYLH